MWQDGQSLLGHFSAKEHQVGDTRPPFGTMGLFDVTGIDGHIDRDVCHGCNECQRCNKCNEINNDNGYDYGDGCECDCYRFAYSNGFITMGDQPLQP